MRILLKIAIFIIPILVVLFYLDNEFDKRLQKNHHEKAHWILNKQQGKYDYAIIGSSRAESMFDVNFVDTLYHLKGINIGINGAGLAENELILNKFLENNKVETLVIMADLYSMNPELGFPFPFHNFVYMPYLKSDTVIARSIRRESSLKKYILWKYFPFARYIEFNNYYPVYNVLSGKYPFDSGWDDKGYRPATPRKRRKMITRQILPKEIIDTNLCYKPSALQNLTSILKICRKYSVRPVLCTAPEFIDELNFFKNCRKEVHILLSELANNYKISFIDYSDSLICKNSVYFNDNSHLNPVGTRIFSKSIIKKL